jgi:hypothetical protein
VQFLERFAAYEAAYEIKLHAKSARPDNECTDEYGPVLWTGVNEAMISYEVDCPLHTNYYELVLTRVEGVWFGRAREWTGIACGLPD